MAELIPLEETKGKFKVAGRVTNMKEEWIYREDTIQKGANKGKKYKSVKICVQSSTVNTLITELFGMEAVQITIGKPVKGQKGHEKKKIPFKDRNKIPKGYRLYGINSTIEPKADGKFTRKTHHAFDAAEFLYDNLNDGDFVEVTGTIRYSEYNDEPQVQYSIESIKRINAIDFDSPDFKEVSSFEQEMVFTGSDKGEDGRIYVSAFVIGYEGKNWNAAQFVINPESGHKDIKKTAKAFEKTCKYGDVITVFGLCLNKTEYITVAAGDEEEIAGIFGGDKPEGLNTTTIKESAKELLIIGAENKTYKPKVYVEDQFVDQELINDEEDDNDLDLEEETFGGGDHEAIDISDDDLPF